MDSYTYNILLFIGAILVSISMVSLMTKCGFTLSPRVSYFLIIIGFLIMGVSCLGSMNII